MSHLSGWDRQGGVLTTELRLHTLVYAQHATSAAAFLDGLFEHSLLHLVLDQTHHI